jgi:membrane protease YdiL (CAAX protease family)
MDTLVILSYAFLYLTVISLWFSRKSKIQIWHILLITSVLLGLFTQLIKPIGIIPVILLPIAIYYEQQKINIGIKIFLFIFIILLCIGLLFHLYPGFNNFKVLSHIYISKNALPFTMYLNIDKTLVGIFILGISHQLISRKDEWIILFKRTIPLMIILILIFIILTMLMGFIHFDPKFPSSLPIWIITNLLFVTTAEEAFFRGFLQKKLCEVMKKIPYGHYLAILCASILFGLLHYPAGIKYILLATIAGIGYGFIYDKTKRIESSIIAHFCFNLTHFLLFTYPVLASAMTK